MLRHKAPIEGSIVVIIDGGLEEVVVVPKVVLIQVEVVVHIVAVVGV